MAFCHLHVSDLEIRNGHDMEKKEQDSRYANRVPVTQTSLHHKTHVAPCAT